MLTSSTAFMARTSSSHHRAWALSARAMQSRARDRMSLVLDGLDLKADRRDLDLRGVELIQQLRRCFEREPRLDERSRTRSTMMQQQLH